MLKVKSKQRALLTANAKCFLGSERGITLVIAAGWQLTMTLFGFLLDTSLGIFKPGMGHVTLLSHIHAWDGGWYYNIIHGAYVTNAAAPVFYPLYPLSVWLVHVLSFGLIGLLVSSIIVNTAALWFALLALYRVGQYFMPGSRRAWIIPVLFLTSPAAIFLHMFYGEAIFCAFVFWAYVYALRRRWFAMAILLGLATASRLPSILFIGLCFLEYLRAHEYSPRKVLNWNMLLFLLTPLGFITYGLYLAVVRGDFLAMFHGYHATNDWSYQKFSPNLIHTYHVLLSQCKGYLTGAVPFDQLQFVNVLLPMIGIGLLVLCCIYLLFRLRSQGIPLAVFGFVTIAFLSINGNLVSIDRYLLPVLPLYIAGLVFAGRSLYRTMAVLALAYAGVLLQAYLFILFITGHFAG